jgi:hypothetical protein
VGPQRIRTPAELTAALERLRAGRSVPQMNQSLAAMRNPPDRPLAGPRITELRQGQFRKAGFEQFRSFLLACGVRREAELTAWEEAWRLVLNRADEPAPDPVEAYRLGVHRALATDDPELADQLTLYVRRSHDDQLGQALTDATASTGSKIIMVVGGSSTGKTRACFEAVTSHQVVSAWRRLYPADAGDLLRLLRAGVGQETVVWLNEAQLHLDPDHPAAGEIAAGLRSLVDEDHRRRLVIVGSMWPSYWDRYTAATDTQRRSPVGQILATAAVKILVPPRFREADQVKLRQAAAGDLRLKVAIQTAGGEGGLVIQTLAGGPQLVDRYEQWADSTDSADQVAWAILTAAMDARRSGWESPQSDDFLRSAAAPYLAQIGSTAQPAGWYEHATASDIKTDALARARVTALVHGIAALTRVRTQTGVGPGDAYFLHDYLLQHANAARRRTIPNPVWPLYQQHNTNPRDRDRLAAAAFRRAIWANRDGSLNSDGIWCLLNLSDGRLIGRRDTWGEEIALRRQAAAGNQFASSSLAKLLARRGDERELRELADAGKEGAAQALVGLLLNRGDEAGLRALVDAGQEGAAQALTRLLFNRADEAGLRALVDAGHEGAAWALARPLIDREDEAGLRALADAGNGRAAQALVEPLFNRGDEAALRGLLEAGHEIATSPLAYLMLIRGDANALRALVDAGHRDAALPLVQLLAHRGDEAGLGELRDAGHEDATWALTYLFDRREDEVGLRALVDAGHGDAASPLARLLLNRRDEPGLRALVDAGHADATWALALLLANRGDEAGLRSHVEAITPDTVDRMANLLERNKDVAGLRVLVNVGHEGAAFALAKLLGRRDEAGMRALVDAGHEGGARAMVQLLARRKDEAGLRALVDAGHEGAALALAELLAHRGDVAELRALVSAGHERVTWALVKLLARRKDEAGLRELAEAGQRSAAEALVMPLYNRGDEAGLRALVDAGHADAEIPLAILLADRGDEARLRALASRGGYAIDGLLAYFLADCGDVERLHELAEAGNDDAARPLSQLLIQHENLHEATATDLDRVSFGLVGRA